MKTEFDMFFATEIKFRFATEMRFRSQKEGSHGDLAAYVFISCNKYNSNVSL